MQSITTAAYLLEKLGVYEDELLWHIYGVLASSETDPFSLCAGEFMEQVLHMKNTSADLISKDNVEIDDKIDLFHTLSLSQPVAVIRMSVRFFATQAECDFTVILTYTKECLKNLARTSNNAALNNFCPAIVPSAKSLEHRSLLLPRWKLLGDDLFAGNFYCHSRKPTLNSRWRVLINKAGAHHVRGPYMQYDGSPDAPCYVSEDKAFLLQRSRILTDSPVDNDKTTFYNWSIISRYSKSVYYTCSTEKISVVPPGYGWRLGLHGSYPVPVLSFTPIQPSADDNILEPAALCIKGDASSAFLGPIANCTKCSKISCTELMSKRFRTGRRAVIEDSVFESKTHTTPTPSEAKNYTANAGEHHLNKNSSQASADSVNVPQMAYPHLDSEAALHLQLDELQAKSLWIQEASVYDICAGYNTEPIAPVIAAESGCKSAYFSSWSIDNLLQMRFMQKMRSLAVTSSQQLQSYIFSLNPQISRESNYKSKVSTLGVEITGSAKKQHLTYVVCINVANFAAIRTLQNVTSDAQKALQEIYSLAEQMHSEQHDETEIGMGCEEETIARHANYDFSAACKSVRNVGRIMNARVSEAILAKIGLDSQKMFTVRKSLSSFCSFHAALVELCEKHSLDELPSFPDPFEIGEVEETVHNSHKVAFTSEKEVSIGIKFAKSFSPESQNEINDIAERLDTEQLLQGCMFQIQNYMQCIFSYVESLESAHATDSNVVNSIGMLVAKFLLAAPLNVPAILPVRHVDAYSMSYQWSAYLRHNPRGLHLQFLVNDAEGIISSRKSDSELLELQYYQCRGCGHGLRVSEVFGVFQRGQNYRRCNYFHALFCKRWCHYGEKLAIPQRLLNTLDTEAYSVSCHAAHFLRSIWDKPLVQLSAVNPSIFAKVSTLATIRNLRSAIIEFMSSILTCNEVLFDRALAKTIGLKRMYMCLTPDLFALNDIASPQLYTQLEANLKKLLEMLDDVS